MALKENEYAHSQQEDSTESAGKDEIRENIFSINEVMVEELAIDGICGVY